MRVTAADWKCAFFTGEAPAARRDEMAEEFRRKADAKRRVA
ncbi:MAG: hypothetical protein Q8Q63_03395 [Phaeovulum sp.]|nr:hypothetical protein [Phaeovulum sp.]MDP2064176.1 hypothetical protein [Phaeovulum sp.]MDP3860610.1 hypothetical protein [Phaeovulum sp.]